MQRYPTKGFHKSFGRDNGTIMLWRHAIPISLPKKVRVPWATLGSFTIKLGFRRNLSLLSPNSATAFGQGTNRSNKPAH